jgi:hypothetical protein
MCIVVMLRPKIKLYKVRGVMYTLNECIIHCPKQRKVLSLVGRRIYGVYVCTHVSQCIQIISKPNITVHNCEKVTVIAQCHYINRP